MTTLLNNFFRIIGRAAHRLQRTKIPITLIGLNLFNLYLFKNSYVSLKSIQKSHEKFQIKPFSDELFQQQKNKQDIIILIDYDYNQAFTQKLDNMLSYLKFQSKHGQRDERNILIMSIKFKNQAEINEFKQKYKIDFSDETIFLIKNRFEGKMVPFTYENIMRNQQQLNVYFSGVPIFNQKYKNNLQRKLDELDKSKTMIIYYLPTQNQNYSQYQRQFKKQQLQLTKYPQYSLIMINKKQDLKQFGLQDVEENTYHLLKKHSKKYSIVEPNFQLFNKNYRLIKNVNLYDQYQNFLIPYYIYKTDLSTKLYSAYNLQIKINKNEINKEQKNKILQTFRNIKTKYKFFDVNFQIKFQKIKEVNKPWMIKIFSFKDQQQDLLIAQNNPNNKQVHTYEYLYNKDEVNEQEMVKFIQDVMNRRIPEYYRSQKQKLISNINRLTSNSFNEKVRNNNLNQLVFQYSNYCSGCKAMYPLIYNFYKNNTNKNIEVYRLNSIKNIVQGEIQYPMTPIVLFYKNNWKSYPLQIPVNVLVKQNGLDDFCQISAQVKSIDKQKLEEHYRQNQNIQWTKLSQNVQK